MITPLFGHIGKKMIVVKLNGGLGNQMFQYAAGRSLAYKTRSQLYLDISKISNDNLRNFELENFKLSSLNKTNYKNREVKNIANKFLNYFSPYRYKTVYKERFFHYNPNFFALRPPVYVSGYFQSEKYFEEIASIIKDEFTIKNSIIKNVEPFSEDILNCNSVSIHIRRGDYNSQAALNYHGLIPMEYYLKAISHINQLIKDPIFYIFTDDINWVSDNFYINNSILLSKQTKSHFEDLHLMSLCKHHIIANSSFSWWGAWLNNNPNKITIAPKNWFKKGPKDTQDLFPKSWIALK